MTLPESRVLSLYGDCVSVDAIAYRCHYTSETVRDILRSYEVSLPEYSRLYGSKRDRATVTLREPRAAAEKDDG